jgi:hypothetical protein
MGPVEARYKSFGRMLCLVVGPRGGISEDFTNLLQRFAHIGAERRWKEMGARSIKEARAVMLTKLRRNFGITGFRGYARLVMDRLGIALGDGKAAFKRRGYAMNAAKEWRDEYDRRAGPMGQGGFRHG